MTFVIRAPKTTDADDLGRVHVRAWVRAYRGGHHWGTGVGPGLLDAAVEALRAGWFAAATLWVHPGNARARAFYEARGWTPDEVGRDQEVLGVTVPEVRYSISL